MGIIKSPVCNNYHKKLYSIMDGPLPASYNSRNNWYFFIRAAVIYARSGTHVHPQRCTYEDTRLRLAGGSFSLIYMNVSIAPGTYCINHKNSQQASFHPAALGICKSPVAPNHGPLSAAPSPVIRPASVAGGAQPPAERSLVILTGTAAL